MTFVLRVLAAIALAAPAAASARLSETPRIEVPAEAEGGTPIPEAATRVADWIAASGDNHALPYAIVDKQNATLLLFDAKGKRLDQVPVLIGIATGDEATAGVGSKKLAEIGPAEKTTPAGRFLAKFGIPFRKERILWVDYATSVAMHTIPADAAKKERRRERMLSPTPDDNRITFGCINVPKAFYGKFLRPQFQKKGGYVYVLPDTKPLEEVFPRLRVHALTKGPAAS
jgi:hypothetical protein